VSQDVEAALGDKEVRVPAGRSYFSWKFVSRLEVWVGVESKGRSLGAAYSQCRVLVEGGRRAATVRHGPSGRGAECSDHVHARNSVPF
jgi:hypothetical protein